MKFRTESRLKSEKLNFWQSYSDIMAALLLVFILIWAVAMFQVKDAESKIQEAKKELDKQKATIALQEVKLKDAQEKITNVVGMRGDLIKALKSALLNSDLSDSISIDGNTGAVILKSSLFFKSDSAQLTKKGTDFLDKFWPTYVDTFLDDDFYDKVSEIIIEGHTDSTGKDTPKLSRYMYNLDLSQKRAFAVAKYCLDNKKKQFTNSQIRKLEKIVTANGRSYSNLKYKYEYSQKNKKNVKVEDRSASRRVEIKFRLHEEEMINELGKALGK